MGHWQDVSKAAGLAVAAPKVVKPRISARFTTAKAPSMGAAPGLKAPSAPAQPKAGRLAATGKRIGGTPAPTAPRIPGPAMPKVGTAAKADQVSKNVPRAVRGPWQNAFHMKVGRTSVDYPIARLDARNDGRAAARNIARGRQAKRELDYKPLSEFYGRDASRNIRSGREGKAYARDSLVADRQAIARRKQWDAEDAAAARPPKRGKLSRTFTRMREANPGVFKAAPGRLLPNARRSSGKFGFRKTPMAQVLR